MQGGKSYNDRVLASEVRTLSLKKIKAILEDENNEKYAKSFQEALLLKLAGTVLPRLNEHTGEDGEPLQISIKRHEDEGNTTVFTAGQSDLQPATV